MPEEIVDRPAFDAEADLQGMPLLSLKHRATEELTPFIVRYALQADKCRAELERIGRLDAGGTAVRAAVQEPGFSASLEMHGLAGAGVECLSLQSIRNIYQVRIALETLAVELVAAQTMPDLRVCWNEIVRMQEAAEEGRALSFYQADFSFHRALWTASRSESLHACLQETVTKVMRFRMVGRISPSRARLMESAALHRQMLAMIAVGNVEAAAKMMVESMKNDQKDDEQLAGVS